jgi:hypothetical protein
LLPSAGVTSRHHTFAVTVNGRRYSGEWQLQDKEVCIRSDYGSRRAAVKHAAPEKVAERILKEIVGEWLASR